MLLDFSLLGGISKYELTVRELIMNHQFINSLKLSDQIIS